MFNQTVRQSIHDDMAAYVADVDPVRFPFVCSVTGQLAGNLFTVIRDSILGYCRSRVLHRWHSVRALQSEKR